jgi:ABC-2 type transport system ATP-binding protein
MLSGMSSAIQARDLRRTFGDFAAVDGIDLDVRYGEIYGFLGPNGAGKSTTVKMLCTLLGITSGSATVAGYDVASQPDEIRLRIGVALQDSSIDGKQSGREMLRLQGRLYGLSAADVERRMDDVIGLVDIGTAIDNRVDSYSGGMKRRLDLAMSLIHRPQVLFLDEPTTGLDPASRASVWAEVRRLNTEYGMTIFLTTQYLEEADELADRVGIIARGLIVAEGVPDVLKREIGADLIQAEVDGDPQTAADALRAIHGIDDVQVHHNELALVTPDGPALIAQVAVALNGCGVPVRSLTLRTPTLDDVYLHVTGTHFSGDDTADDPTITTGAPS